MIFDLSSVVILLIVGSLVGFWWKARSAQERALGAVKIYCQNMQLQLLDECVVEASWKIGRANSGSLCLLRHYEFEFTSTGNERYLGAVTMRGQRVEQINVAPHRIQ